MCNNQCMCYNVSARNTNLEQNVLLAKQHKSLVMCSSGSKKKFRGFQLSNTATGLKKFNYRIP